MISSAILRDRIDDVIADMERQFVGLAPTVESLALEMLNGKKSAYLELQSFGRSVLAPIIDHYGVAVGALAADWYDLNRELARLTGPWTGAVTQEPNIDTGPLVGGTVKEFVTVESITSGVLAGMDMRVRQAGHGTIMDSTLRDPKATGWGRTTSAGCCSYCAMLAGRGNVYRTQHTATFSPHLHCRCGAVPAWGGSTVALRSRADTVATRRKFSADPVEDAKIRARYNKQARQWVEANQDSLGLL